MTQPLSQDQVDAWRYTYRYLLVLAAALPDLHIPRGASDAVDCTLTLLGPPRNEEEAAEFIRQLQQIAVTAHLET